VKDELITGLSLRLARLHLRVTQAEVAERMGVSASLISTIESGRKPFTLDWAQRYLAALDPGKTVRLFVHVRAFIGDECAVESSLEVRGTEPL
jgi:transcriptional regulator with XRE-family HTH domain